MTYYLKEFPDYGTMDVSAPEGFKDSSWHNDICPSFTNEAKNLIIWVDYADPEKREYPLTWRFMLCSIDADGICSVVIAESDSWADILAAIQGVDAQQ